MHSLAATSNITKKMTVKPYIGSDIFPSQLFPVQVSTVLCMRCLEVSAMTVFGTVLKIDSIKNRTKKLKGIMAG